MPRAHYNNDDPKNMFGMNVVKLGSDGLDAKAGYGHTEIVWKQMFWY